MTFRCVNSQQQCRKAENGAHHRKFMFCFEPTPLVHGMDSRITKACVAAQGPLREKANEMLRSLHHHRALWHIHLFIFSIFVSFLQLFLLSALWDLVISSSSGNDLLYLSSPATEDLFQYGYRYMHKRSSTSSQIYTGAYITSISKAMLKAARKEVEKSAKSAEVRKPHWAMSWVHGFRNTLHDWTGTDVTSLAGDIYILMIEKY